MSTINNVEPAFPAAGMTGRGMSLRDYFAAKAMQSLIAEGVGFNSDPKQINPMCATAYEWADAMLNAREVQP